jgi:16S rRNA processing protein RimM
LVSRDGSRQEAFDVLESRPHKKIILVHLAKLESLNELEPWIGSEVHLERNELPEMGENSIYHWEAIGLEVRTIRGTLVGQIEEIQAMPNNDLWVVRLGDRESLIPVVEPIVVEIDLPGRTATIDPPDGLIPEE